MDAEKIIQNREWDTTPPEYIHYMLYTSSKIEKKRIKRVRGITDSIANLFSTFNFLNMYTVLYKYSILAIE